PASCAQDPASVQATDASVDARYVDCDDSGLPTDLLADKFNCGRCGHSCLGAPCSTGACAPEVVVDGGGRVLIAGAADSTRFYWSTSALTAYAAPLDGGPATYLASSADAGFNDPQLHDLRVDTTTAFVRAYNGLLAVPIEGGPVLWAITPGNPVGGTGQ